MRLLSEEGAFQVAATKKTAVPKAGGKKRAAKTRLPKSMPKAGKNPEGGLTAAGRKYFAAKEGSHLRPGVTGAADTPEKMMRKGSFLRRHFTHPRGPMIDEKGQPTRLALSAHAWGEPVPKTMADARKLAAKGHTLLERYHAVQEQTTGRKAAAKKSVSKTAAKKSTTRRAEKKTATKRAAKSAAR